MASVNPAPTNPSRAATAATALRQLLIGVKVLLVLTVICGVIYPLAVFGIGRLMPAKADGSLVTNAAGEVVGSALIGQQFDGPWFVGRPSVADYDALASGGSNLGPANPDLAATIAQRRAAVAAANGVDPALVPADAVTASASGLDPDISPAYARLQITRVATARGLSVERVTELVQAQVKGRVVGFLGQPRVNVLELNLALERLDAP